MSRTLFVLLTVLITLGLAMSLFAQAVILPQTAADEVASFPAYQPYAAPLVTLGIAFLFSAQVTLVALWALLLRADQDVFFQPGSQRWMTVIIAALGFATLLVVGLFGFLTFYGLPTPPEDDMADLGLWMLSGLGCLILAALLGVALVVRALLKRAINTNTEMEGVI